MLKTCTTIANRATGKQHETHAPAGLLPLSADQKLPAVHPFRRSNFITDRFRQPASPSALRQETNSHTKILLPSSPRSSLEQQLGKRVRHDRCLLHKISWPRRASVLKFPVVVLQQVHQNELDLIRSKKAPRTGMDAMSKIDVIQAVHPISTSEKEKAGVMRKKETYPVVTN